MTRSKRLAPALAGFLLVLSACGDDGSDKPLRGLAPDFSLRDVNPNSATFDSTLSPRDYLEQVSAWYFGHAT